jgi:sulfur carrier protein ThiS
MITVNITLFPPFSKGATREETSIFLEEGLTVKDLLKHLVSGNDNFKTYLGEISQEEDLRLRALVLHNEQVARLDQDVQDGDFLSFLHPLQGG